MSILFGHPTGNPNAHHAALAHFEAGTLEAFCVAWMPSRLTLRLMSITPGFGSMADRLGRRHFAPLAKAPKEQGILREMFRLMARASGQEDERLSYERNDWLMRLMARKTGGKRVTAVHSYEDCSLWQFEEAKRKGKACIYDMPIGYHSVWERTRARLIEKYSDWLPGGGRTSGYYERREQKNAEMALADLVFAPTAFVEQTIREYHPQKKIARAAYGVDLDFWTPAPREKPPELLTVIYAGQISLRKGIPDLLIAWGLAGLKQARLLLIGQWQLSETRKRTLPRGVEWHPACGPEALRQHYREADIFVFPSHFEGFGLVLLEAMACGLPALATEATAMKDLQTGAEGRLIESGNVDDLVAALRWAAQNREQLPELGRAARARAERFTWSSYRHAVRNAVVPYI